MNWYCGTGPEGDVVLSSRVRLARNLTEFPFPHKLSDAAARKVADRVEEALLGGNAAMKREFASLEMDAMEEVDRLALLEKHLVSKEFVAGGPGRRALVNRDESISMMINEEDHVRIQAMRAGLSLDETYADALRLAVLLEEKMDIGFHPKFGYSTACPTNTGTGMRASVMVHLPALTMTGYVANLIEGLRKIGFTVRGLYGENSEATGSIFQISNQITLGVSEEETITDLKRIVAQALEQERGVRKELYRLQPLTMEDRVHRAYGILKNARRMTSEEALRLLSDLRLGVSLGIVRNLREDGLNRLTLNVGPATLQKTVGRTMSPDERDAARATAIRDSL